jgi:tetratricopeptide (TPR) repeat protein
VLSPASREGKESTVSKRDDLALLRRRKQNEAIAYASQGDWFNAAEANTAMLYEGINPADLKKKDPEEELKGLNSTGLKHDSEVEPLESTTSTTSETLVEQFTIGDLVALSSDVETLNRLAKAQYELGNVEFARQIYQRVLTINENNQIAKRMISLLDHTETRASKERKFADMRTFVVETGKSTITTMHIDQATAIALVPGELVEMRIVGQADDIELEPERKSKTRTKKRNPENEVPIETPTATTIPVEAHAIDIYDAGNTLLGRLEPRLAQRIIDFMRQGNKYMAVVWRVSEHYHMIDLVIRESYRNPDLTGSVSFPGKLNDEEKSALMDPIDEDIDDPGADGPYALDMEEETAARLTYDDDDDSFDGGDDNADGDDDVEDFAPKKGKASGRTNTLLSLDEVQRDETRKNTYRDTEDE